MAWTTEVTESREKLSGQILQEAEIAALPYCMNVHTALHTIGTPAGSLLDEADALNADLIAVGSTQKSRFGCLFFGSVGRALAIGSPKSVLISKKNSEKGQRIRGIFATDHSDYADRALVKLARLRPGGFEKITLVTALTKEMLGDTNQRETEVMSNLMAIKSANAVQHLHEAGIAADYIVAKGEFAPVVDHHVNALRADLLILGAQGHGFLERLFIGSSALHEVVATDHSVLIIRP